MKPGSVRQPCETTGNTAGWSFALLLLVAALGAGCGHTPQAYGSRPPNAPEYAEHSPPPSAATVVLDMPNPHEAVQDPDAAIALIGQQATTVERELRVALSKNATRTVNCISDKLSQIHAQERMGTSQANAIKEAKASSDSTREHQARVMLAVARDRAEKLAREADRCGGEVSNGHSETEMEIDRTRSASMDSMPVVPAR